MTVEGLSGWIAWRRMPVPGQRMLHALLVAALAVVIYLPGMGNAFAYDDLPIVYLDERVHDLDLTAIFSGGYWQNEWSALYRPLTTLSYAIDWSISGGTPAWFHLMNAVIHGAITAMLLLLLRGLRAPTVPALLGAAIFAVHPVHVEAVANIVGRGELLAAGFMLGAALLFVRPMRTLRRKRGIALLLVLFAMALLSKESAVVLPGLLVLVDVIRGRLRTGRISAWLKLRRIPLLGVAGLLGAYFGIRWLVLGALTPSGLDPSLEVLESRLGLLLTAFQAWPQYLRLLFYPRILLADYGPRIMLPAAGLTPTVVLGIILLATCMIGGVISWRRHRYWTAGALLWFPIAILPVSNLLVPIGVLVAERTLYLPSIALSLAIPAMARPLSGMSFRQPARRLALAAASGVVLGTLTARTMIRTPDWRTTNTIFFALLQDRPDAFRAVWHMARVAVSQGKPAAAMNLHADAIRLWPYRPGLLREAVIYAASQGRSDWAHELAEFSLQRVPDELVIRRFHAGTLLDNADTVAAREHIIEGLKWHPQDSLLLRMHQAVTPRTDYDTALRP